MTDARSDGAIIIRPFTTTEEYRECVALQEATWGIGFSERVSPAILKVAQILGGVSAGAYDAAGVLVGFVFGMTGLRNGELVHWSDMLAVRPELRDAGLGRRLKAYQRKEVLRRGVRTMHWTFDPLQSRNAWLNVTRLGAVVREYAENMYGDTDSHLHQGIGTDRFITLWQLDSERVVERLASVSLTGPAEAPPTDHRRRAGAQRGAAEPTSHARSLDEHAPVVLTALHDDDAHPRPGVPDLSLDAPSLRVQIPADIGTVMAADPALALDWRTATRAAFRHYLDLGYEVREFERGDPASTYWLAPTGGGDR